MKKINSKKIIVYMLIIFSSLIIVGLVGAIIRLINLPAIFITLTIIIGISYSKKAFWPKEILQTIFKIRKW